LVIINLYINNLNNNLIILKNIRNILFGNY